MPPMFGTGVNAELSCTLGMTYAYWATETGTTYEEFQHLTTYYARDDFSVDIDGLISKIKEIF